MSCAIVAGNAWHDGMNGGNKRGKRLAALIERSKIQVSNTKTDGDEVLRFQLFLILASGRLSWSLLSSI